MFRLTLILLLISSFSFGQKLSKADRKTVGFLQSQVGFLASDALKGRRAGDSGEILAGRFIADKFKEIGLTPKGTALDSYFQPFAIYDGKMIDDRTSFTVNGKQLKLGVDYFPLSNSVSGSSNASCTPAILERDQPWFFDLADALTDNKENPHFDINVLILDKLKQAKEKGAPFIVFYNSSSLPDMIKFDPKDRSELSLVPALYLTSSGKKDFFSDFEADYTLNLHVAIGIKNRNASNVIGYIDNKAALTIVMGAHFDHLGYGEDGNSMIRGGDPAIHNGADDNASGTASLIELAFALKKSKSKQYNYLFIAFSAEELGLNGSKYFVENPTVDLKNINYMINMDMVGRMNDSTQTITVGGYGTSPNWDKMITAVSNKGFSIKTDSSGSGPSDHTSFYRKDIPVLFFFTGLHTDYHKPSDDADKINYVGMLKIIKFIQQLISMDKTATRLPFLKTREQQTGTSTRFSVSLGIMPDYSFSGNGVRVDGVSDNRPAKKAGIVAGDIVKQLGDIKTSSVEAYMQALSKFKKGDATFVIVMRKDQELKFDIIF
jgi:aminopeptidase YwaD